jgi:hypothetical protein
MKRAKNVTAKVGAKVGTGESRDSLDLFSKSGHRRKRGSSRPLALQQSKPAAFKPCPLTPTESHSNSMPSVGTRARIIAPTQITHRPKPAPIEPRAR